MVKTTQTDCLFSGIFLYRGHAMLLLQLASTPQLRPSPENGGGTVEDTMSDMCLVSADQIPMKSVWQREVTVKYWPWFNTAGQTVLISGHLTRSMSFKGAGSKLEKRLWRWPYVKPTPYSCSVPSWVRSASFLSGDKSKWSFCHVIHPSGYHISHLLLSAHSTLGQHLRCWWHLSKQSFVILGHQIFEISWDHTLDKL